MHEIQLFPLNRKTDEWTKGHFSLLNLMRGCQVCLGVQPLVSPNYNLQGSNKLQAVLFSLFLFQSPIFGPIFWEEKPACVFFLRHQFASFCDINLDLILDLVALPGGTRVQPVLQCREILAHVREKSGAASSRVGCRNDPIM